MRRAFAEPNSLRATAPNMPDPLLPPTELLLPSWAGLTPARDRTLTASAAFQAMVRRDGLTGNRRVCREIGGGPIVVNRLRRTACSGEVDTGSPPRTCANRCVTTRR